jgi:hypothetical protein
MSADDAIMKLDAAAAFLTSPRLVAQLVEGMQSAVIRAHSPWLTRKDAADYARCSTSEIDRAAKAGFLPVYQRGGTPMFRRDDIDEAISAGKWKPAGQ